MKALGSFNANSKWQGEERFIGLWGGGLPAPFPASPHFYCSTLALAVVPGTPKTLATGELKKKKTTTNPQACPPHSLPSPPLPPAEVLSESARVWGALHAQRPGPDRWRLREFLPGRSGRSSPRLGPDADRFGKPPAPGGSRCGGRASARATASWCRGGGRLPGGWTDLHRVRGPGQGGGWKPCLNRQRRKV